MDEKNSPDKPLATRTEAEGETVDLPEGLGAFATGQVLGDRNEILEMLGHGGAFLPIHHTATGQPRSDVVGKGKWGI